VSLWKSYAAGVLGCSARVWVLRGVTFTVEPGERVAIVGARGAGKSTLAACILGLRHPDAGSIEASGLTNGTLRLLGAPRWHLGLSDSAVGRGAAILLFTERLAGMHALADRALLLRDGELAPMGSRSRLFRVAESPLRPTPGSSGGAAPLG
jgi:ABC-type multidrug transport system ATPase subunit